MPGKKKNDPTITEIGPLNKDDHKRWRDQEKKKQKAIWEGTAKDEEQPKPK